MNSPQRLDHGVGIGGIGGGAVKSIVPMIHGKSEEVFRIQQKLTGLARRAGCDRVFTESSTMPEVGMGDPKMSLTYFQERFGVDVVQTHRNAWEKVISKLISENNREVMFEIRSPSAAWRTIREDCSPQTQEGALNLMSKLDSTRRMDSDGSTETFAEMESITRVLGTF